MYMYVYLPSFKPLDVDQYTCTIFSLSFTHCVSEGTTITYCVYTSLQLNKCLYGGKHLEHSSMRLQTHCLWFQGEKVTSGAVVSSTRVSSV